MSVWTDRIKNHGIWQNFETLASAIEQAVARTGITPAASESLVRVRTVASVAKKRLSSADPMLVHPGVVEGISAAIQASLTEVQHFVANGNEGHLSNANTNIDNAASQMAQFVVPPTAKETSALKVEVDAYRETLEKNLRRAHESMEAFTVKSGELQEELDKISEEAAGERQKLSTAANDFQNQFSNSQDERKKEFERGLGEYAEELTNKSKEFTRQGDALLQAQKDELAGLTTTYKDSAAKILGDIQSHLKAVEKLVGVIGNLGVTSGYQKAANEARLTARVWQGIAVLALGAIIWVAAVAFLPLVQGDFKWESFAGRVFVTLTVGVLAAYAISQADRYQQVERRSRKLALELEALGPFIAPLPVEKQEEFRLRVGDRSFGTSHDLIDDDAVSSPKSVVDLALKSKDLRAFVVDIIKAVRPGA